MCCFSGLLAANGSKSGHYASTHARNPSTLTCGMLVHRPSSCENGVTPNFATLRRRRIVYRRRGAAADFGNSLASPFPMAKRKPLAFFVGEANVVNVAQRLWKSTNCRAKFNEFRKGVQGKKCLKFQLLPSDLLIAQMEVT